MNFLTKVRRKKAVAYYRHSAEDKQENSVPLQRDFVRDFLKKHDVELIHEEADEGESGLTAHRPAFQKLFNDWILNQKAPEFDYVVYYDVSRMGRFEDSDEAGHYEFQCKQMGKEVVYARRGFPATEEQRGMSQVQTAFERWMSFQYSKKLSEDVIRGCLEISGQGYSVGGQAPYGMARMLLSAGDRKPIRIMQDGEHKSIANERIIFVPKDDHTTETVKEIFNRFLDEDLNFNEIAQALNNKGVVSSNGGEWNRGKIYRILSNPVYKGTLIYNKNWGRLKRKKRRNPISDWVICTDAFPALIAPERFDQTQERLHWLLPSKYRKGFYLLKKTKKSVQNDIRSVLERAGIDPEYAQFVPLSFAVKRYMPDLTPYWCFFISRKIEESKEVLCISIDMDRNDSIDRAFLVPTKAFNLIGMCLFTEHDSLYSQAIRKEEDIEPTVVTLLERYMQN